MSNPYFSFKRFTVWHDRCAMKAGTDSVILGAYVSCDGVVRRILDVGAGCGILSLMMAQRFPEAEITGVEIDVEAACQARENAAASEWAGRIRMENCDFRLFEDEESAGFSSKSPASFKSISTTLILTGLPL